MTHSGSIFINRRQNIDRRDQPDPCKSLNLDLFHRKRRKSLDRRNGKRTLPEDYYAFIESQGRQTP